MQPTRLPIPEHLRSQFAVYFESPQVGEQFRNPWPHEPLPKVMDVLRWKARGKQVRPRDYRVQPLPAVANALAEFNATRGAISRMIWIGHASFLLELDGARFVIDPIFGRAGGLVPRVTPPAAQPEQLTGLSAVLVTHGHHDHLDPSALRRIAIANEMKVPFVVPRGLGVALPRDCERIELDWWEYVSIDGVKLHLVPAQHWHRRGMRDQNKSLWGGFVLEGTHRIYHSGDTGYFGGFSAIGGVFGGIDAACLPLGAYEPRWFMNGQHMSPEQSLQALSDLGGTHFVGMHWGAYDLSDEALEAGPELARSIAKESGLPEDRLHIVLPGGFVDLHGVRGATTAVEAHGFTGR